MYHARRLRLALAPLCLLAGCGGGDADLGDPPSGAASTGFSAAANPTAATSSGNGNGRRRVLAEAAASGHAGVTADDLLDWAAYRYPALFDTDGVQRLPGLAYQGMQIDARRYHGPFGERFLGVAADGAVFGLGDFTGGQLQAFDTLASWAPRVLASRLNGCPMPSYQALARGTHIVANYRFNYPMNSGGTTGESSEETRVLGPARFEGQDAIRVHVLHHSLSRFGLERISRIVQEDRYVQATDNDLVAELGWELQDWRTYIGDVASFAPYGRVEAVRRRAVHAPGATATEWLAAPGQSVQRNGSWTETTTVLHGSGAGAAPETISHTDTSPHLFVGRETLQLGGRNIDTCKYVIGTTMHTTRWVIAGTGIEARVESLYRGAHGVIYTGVRVLTSGSINGLPL